MISLPFGIQRHFLAKRKFDIVNDADFRLPNEMKKAVMTQIKRSGKGTVQHKEVISDADIDKLYSSDAVSVDNPLGLQPNVFLDVKLYTCRRGREILRNMKSLTLL
jgi:hypothetical protein